MTREIEGQLHAAARRGHLQSTSGLSKHPSFGQGSCHLMGVNDEKGIQMRKMFTHQDAGTILSKTGHIQAVFW